MNILTSENDKSYRLKKRYSFFPSDNSPFRVDMTIVKSSTGYNIKKSNVFSKNEEFQVELELLPRQIGENITIGFEKFLKCYLS